MNAYVHEATVDYHVYIIRGCEIRPRSRVVIAGGIARKIEPKVFDLLVYLINHRGRVVFKNELLTEVWKRVAVSDSVLARAVMKARTAIGDTDLRRPIIRTAHRVGYQFIGDCAVEVETMLELRDIPGSSTRIVVLPFESDLDDRAYGWVPLGMMSQLRAALSLNPYIRVVPTVDTLRAVEGFVTLSIQKNARELCQALAVDYVVHVFISKLDCRFEAKCTLFGGDRTEVLDKLTAGNLLGLLPQLESLFASTLVAHDAPILPGSWRDHHAGFQPLAVER